MQWSLKQKIPKWELQDGRLSLYLGEGVSQHGPGEAGLTVWLGSGADI